MVLLNKKMEQLLIALKKVNIPERDYIFDSLTLL